ncbi:MAG: hypothetical protein ABSD03_06720 [Vulcanimicrobiaceae bacterium]|jgi:hypothetical protein
MITIRPTAMRPIASKVDEDNAFTLFFAALHNDPEGFKALVPNAAEPKPVAIAEDGASAEFEIYAGHAEWWEPTNVRPIGRVLVERTQPNMKQRVQ